MPEHFDLLVGECALSSICVGTQILVFRPSGLHVECSLSIDEPVVWLSVIPEMCRLECEKVILWANVVSTYLVELASMVFTSVTTGAAIGAAGFADTSEGVFPPGSFAALAAFFACLASICAAIFS